MYRETLRSAEINYGDNVTEDEKVCIEKSVAALIDRSVKNTARRRSVHDLQAKIQAAQGESLPDVSQFKPNPVEQSIDRSGPLLDDPAMNVDHIIRIGGVASKVFAKPFHYDWKWSEAGGAYQLTYSAIKDGYAAIDALVDRDVAHINAHAGIGVAFTTETLGSTVPIQVMARSLRWTFNRWSAFGSPNNGHAVTEGGVDLAVFANDSFVTITNPNNGKIWRARRSNGELAQSEEDPTWVLGDTTVEVIWNMVPGVIYTLNVGAWAYVECDDGRFNDSWAWGHLLLDVGALTIFK